MVLSRAEMKISRYTTGEKSADSLISFQVVSKDTDKKIPHYSHTVDI
jgi:hypothetical protein